jgi:hypothetical protein
MPERIAPGGAEHVAGRHGDTGRDRTLDELGQHVHEAVGLLAVGVVPDALEDLQLASRDGLVRGEGVVQGDDRVGVAPDDQRGNFGRYTVRVVASPQGNLSLRTLSDVTTSQLVSPIDARRSKVAPRRSSFRTCPEVFALERGASGSWRHDCR